MVLPEDAQWADMTEMDIAVAKMAGKGMPAHQVWLPPLEEPDTFDQLMPDLAPVEGLGFVSMQWRERGTLVFPMGTKDLPLEQRRDVLTFDLSGAAGNFAVVGGPLTGKSMVLQDLRHVPVAHLHAAGSPVLHHRPRRRYLRVLRRCAPRRRRRDARHATRSSRE